MSLWNRIFGGEKRSRSTARTSDPYLAEFFGLGGAAGPAVSPEAVLSNIAVAVRCVSLRSELTASVGLHVFRRKADGGRDRADDLPLYDVLHNRWNPNLSAFEGRELMARDLDLHGNHFAQIERNGRGQVTALHPVPARDVGVERLPGGRLRYRIGGEVFLQDDILHVRAASRDGVIGVSPIQQARGAVGFALTQAETARSFTEHALRPSGLISVGQSMGPDAKDRLRRVIEDNFTGPSRSGRFLIMDGGAEFKPIDFKPADAEFLASRKLSNEDTARIFGVPPTSVGLVDKATYSNSEHEGRALVSNALGPLCARIEAAMMRCLLSETARRSLYIEHDLSGLLRGDTTARFEAYRIGREIGALSANDIRRKENDPPIGPEGDTYHQPANWVPLGSTAPATAGGVA